MKVKAYTFSDDCPEYSYLNTISKELIFEADIDNDDLGQEVYDSFYSLLDMNTDYCVQDFTLGEEGWEFIYKRNILGRLELVDSLPDIYGKLYSKYHEKESSDVEAVENDPPVKEEVNHPDRYNHDGIEAIDVMRAFMGKDAVMDFDICNVIKYVLRFKEKNGIEDLKKAQWYLDNYISLYENAESE